MKSRKKGSLTLSINAIVVLILAITILGLGLGFIRSLFGSSTDSLEAMAAELETQTIDDALRSGQLLYFPQVNIQTGIGRPTSIVTAITNNLDQEFQFSLNFTCTSARGASCDDFSPGWFDTFEDVTIQRSDARVFPIEITPQRSGSYMLEVSAIYEDDSDVHVYASRDFYLTVR